MSRESHHQPTTSLLACLLRLIFLCAVLVPSQVAAPKVTTVDANTVTVRFSQAPVANGFISKYLVYANHAENPSPVEVPPAAEMLFNYTDLKSDTVPALTHHATPSTLP